ncbi:MAG TPA: NAD kinase [Candidatus Tetragenococcus pullicola]|nr:NAD kinase [Candidatus Tetragenococcus pullicola]
MTVLKVAIVSNQTPKSAAANERLHILLKEAGHTIDQKDPDIVISIGGDGTLLSAFHLYNHKLDHIRFLGVHTGHLGFYTDWRDYELEELVESLCRDEKQRISYPLLDVSIRYHHEKEDRHFLALNESTIKRGNSTMVADIYIKDDLFERFRGDGVSLSTPTGSTAYNKSVGGAVLHPSINALQLSEIASLNNRVYRTLGSPLIVPEKEWVTIKLPETTDYAITVDQISIREEQIDSICYQIAKERIQFASYRHTHFWDRVRDAFIGELE